MHIRTFEEKNFTVRRKTEPVIRVTYNRLIISAKLVKLIGLKGSDRVLLHQDTYQPHIWYLSIDERGFQLNSTTRSTGFYLFGSELTMMILGAFGFDKTGTFLFKIDGDPIEHEGVKHWKLAPQI